MIRRKLQLNKIVIIFSMALLTSCTQWQQPPLNHAMNRYQADIKLSGDQVTVYKHSNHKKYKMIIIRTLISPEFNERENQYLKAAIDNLHIFNRVQTPAQLAEYLSKTYPTNDLDYTQLTTTEHGLSKASNLIGGILIIEIKMNNRNLSDATRMKVYDPQTNETYLIANNNNLGIFPSRQQLYTPLLNALADWATTN